MSGPTNMAEYFALFEANQRIAGFGFELIMHVPCPFCAAPYFLSSRIVTAQADWSKGGTCKVCARSAKAIFHGNGKWEIVQTGGPDAPPWLTPKMRRISA
jgi:hypothetical protein